MSLRVVILCGILAPTVNAEASGPKRVDFGKDIYAVFRSACFECHGENKQEADLRLDQPSSMLESTAVVPGKPDASELVRRISLPRGHEEAMPVVGERLGPRQVERIRDWIEQGARWPDGFEAGQHWAYRVPVRPPRPVVAQRDWPANDVDRFVLARLEEEGWQPSPEADRATLLRRVYLDLIGLPPAPEAVAAFLADTSPNAYENVVDELLKRKQFGERWARPWLDVARYADSHGFQRDNLRDIWAWRDWVIRALNDDMPFDQFTIEQIAGDLLPDATESQKIATGFHRCTPTNVEAGSLPEETRIEQVIDRVNTTGAVWLGTTLECAQCHDHKYDPFTMKDYYRLLGYFNSTELEADRSNPKVPSSIAFRGPSMPISDPNKDARRQKLAAQIAELRRQQDERRNGLANDLAAWREQFARQLGEQPTYRTLTIEQFKSRGARDSHQVLDDGSVLLAGAEPPDKDVYTFECAVPVADVRAIQIDVLRHESLPGKGPGRGDPVRRNYIVSEFSGSLPDGTPLEFVSARADFSQKKWNIAQAIDGKRETGWAVSPQFDTDHWGLFILKEPLNLKSSAGNDTKISFRIDQQYGAGRTIGRFRISAVTGNLDTKSVPAEIAKAVRRTPDKWSENERRRVVEFRLKTDPAALDLDKSIAKVEAQQKKLAADTTLVMIETPEPRMTSIFDRGDYRKPQDQVEPGTPAALHAAHDGPANRLTLARWLVDPANPLVARVTVNRWWAEIFGQGIVTTVEDFGVKGEPPTHPELLDWLAVEYVANGWSLKQLLRTIVLSATYRQSSRVTPELLEGDSENRLLARGPSFRMDAEMIRDNALAVAGLLSLKQFGPPIRPFQPAGIWSKVGGTSYKYEVSPGEDQYRRGIYVVLKRGAPYPSFINFDATARLSCTVKRSRTNTPLQALTLLNDPVYVEAAKAFARRIMTSDAKATGARIEFAFQTCVGRYPSSFERETVAEFFEQQMRVLSQDAAQAKALIGEFEIPPGCSPAEFAAWSNVATTLLNLHETITKP